MVPSWNNLIRTIQILFSYISNLIVQIQLFTIYKKLKFCKNFHIKNCLVIQVDLITRCSTNTVLRNTKTNGERDTRVLSPYVFWWKKSGEKWGKFMNKNRKNRYLSTLCKIWKNYGLEVFFYFLYRQFIWIGQ